MENMNKNLGAENQSSEPKKLDKKGKKILIISLILSLIMIVLGIIGPNLGTNRYDPADDNYGGSSSYVSLYLNEEHSTSAYSGDYYEYRYYASNSGTCYILIDGGYLSSLQKSNGSSVYHSSTSSSSYDYAYSFSAQSGTSYTIKVFAESYALKVKVTDSIPTQLTLNVGSSKYVSSGSYYEFTYTSSGSGYMYFLIDGGTLSSITNSNGSSVSKYVVSSSSYEHAYEFYTSSSYTYTFRVYTNSSYIYVKVSSTLP